MGNPVVHFEIAGKDSAALQSFHERAIEWDVAPPNPDLGTYAMVNAKGGHGNANPRESAAGRN